MSTDNPEDWVDLVGLGVLAFAGVASSVLPTWFMKRKGKGGAEKDTNVSDDKDVERACRRSDLDDLLAQVTQLRRSATNHFGESALADSVVVKLRETAFDSEERIKEAIRAVHRDVRQCAKDLDN